MEKWKLEKRVIDLVCSIFHHGGFKAETPSERELETILTELGKWPTNEGTCIKNTDWWIRENEKIKESESSEEGLNYSEIGKAVIRRIDWLKREMDNLEKDSEGYKLIGTLLEENEFIISITEDGRE
jgi:hypothetical protein